MCLVCQNEESPNSLQNLMTCYKSQEQTTLGNCYTRKEGLPTCWTKPDTKRTI